LTKLKDNFYIMNLIDSPGHIEFGFEVSSGLRVCDGAFVLVDVVEGVLAQTYTVLKKAMEEGLSCVLVLNKIDKLITDLDLNPMEAYHHLTQIIGKFFVVEIVRFDECSTGRVPEGKNCAGDWQRRDRGVAVGRNGREVPVRACERECYFL
jgi:ribosome assembly protein 1